jgi:hypothetical protein
MKVIIRADKCITFQFPGVNDITIRGLKPKPVRSILFFSGGSFNDFVSSFKPSDRVLLDQYFDKSKV